MATIKTRERPIRFSDHDKAFICGICCALASARPIDAATIRRVLQEAGVNSLDHIRGFVPEHDIDWIEHAFERAEA